MASFLQSLLSAFRRSATSHVDDAAHRYAEPGPYSTGATIEAQSPARRRRFWQSNMSRLSKTDTVDASKQEKTRQVEKMGTVYGVFIPTTLNVLSILMYLRVTTESTSADSSTGLYLVRVAY